jgi:propanediol dehydratase small subunit
MNKKDYALKKRVGDPNFSHVMNMIKADELKKMSQDEILNIYNSISDYEEALQRCEPYEMAKEWVRDKTKRLLIARDWLKEQDPTLFFVDTEDSDDDN